MALGFRDGSVIESTFCFSRGPVVDSQQLCWLTDAHMHTPSTSPHPNPTNKIKKSVVKVFILGGRTWMLLCGYGSLRTALRSCLYLYTVVGFRTRVTRPAQQTFLPAKPLCWMINCVV